MTTSSAEDPVGGDPNGDVCANRHGGAPTSVDAHASLDEGALETLRTRAIEFLASRGADGATCEELERAFDVRHQTMSARCTELKRSGIVRDSGKRRSTSSGRAASVLEIAMEEFKK